MDYFNKMLIRAGVDQRSNVNRLREVVVFKKRNNAIYLRSRVDQRGAHLFTQLPGIHDIKLARRATVMSISAGLKGGRVSETEWRLSTVSSSYEWESSE